MKKLFMLLILLLVLVMAACSQTEDNADNANAGDVNNEQGEDTGDADENAVKVSVLKNYMNVASSLRLNQKTINTYLGEVTNPDTEAADLEVLQADAIAAAQEASATIDSYTVENLDEGNTAVFEEALVELKSAYDEYATALATEEVDITAAEAKIIESNDKLAVLFEEVGISSAPNLSKELN